MPGLGLRDSTPGNPGRPLDPDDRDRADPDAARALRAPAVLDPGHGAAVDRGRDQRRGVPAALVGRGRSDRPSRHLAGPPLPGRMLRSEHVDFDANHMLERCRLFLIIALGESVLSSGTAIADASRSLLTVVAGTCGLVTIVALWGLHFVSSGRLMDRYVDTTTDPILAARRTVNGLLVSVAGLIAVAVANELVIAHPDGQTSVTLSL